MYLKLIIFSLTLAHFTSAYSACVHEQLSRDTPIVYYNDKGQGRLLDNEPYESMRVFVDYEQIQEGNITEKNIIKRMMNISANYIYNAVKVKRKEKLYFPINEKLSCNILKVPIKYAVEGFIGDVAILVSNEKQPSKPYVAKSTSCAHLKSDNRPFFGIVIFNNPYLKFDQHGFQQVLLVALHEIIHIIGFSSRMYDLYPAGNPLVTVVTNGVAQYYFNSPQMQREIKKHYNCTSSKGMPLEDQDGTLIPSHWERKTIGKQFMIASSKKGGHISSFTLALLESTGWYQVNYDYSQKSTWGKNAGCKFFDRDNCNFPQFCNSAGTSCDWEGTAVGTCAVDQFAGSCKIVNYYSNTICFDENFGLKNLNKKLQARERGGYLSKCFTSDFRKKGLDPSKINNRCYFAVCSVSKRFIFILIGQSIFVCYYPGQIIKAPSGLDGTITCPTMFQNYCQNTQICPFHCNKNGACINGKCLCTGSLKYTSTCLDESVAKINIQTGGLTKSRRFRDPISGQNLVLYSKKDPGLLEEDESQTVTIKKYSHNKSCMQTTFLDPIFGDCLKCKDVFNCDYCSEKGCLSCDNGYNPLDGRCT